MDLPFLRFGYDFQFGYDRYPFAAIPHLTMKEIGERTWYLMELERTLVHCWMISNQMKSSFGLL